MGLFGIGSALKHIFSLLCASAIAFAALVPAAQAATKPLSKPLKTAKTIVKPAPKARVLRAHVTLRRAKPVVRYAAVPLKPSFGQLAGLHGGPDALQLKSSVAFVIDQDTNEVLLNKNSQAVLPIASITKLMTGVVLSEAHLPMDQMVTITQDDVDSEKGTRSRLVVGTELSRAELLHLALMSSENRAAHALGRTYPGGLDTFVGLMNTKAQALGMVDTHYVEPTGLSSKNQSSAKDLAKLVNFAYGNDTLRELTTSPGYQVAVGKRNLQFVNTNRLVHNPAWDIGIQKTGFINEAGQCLVMQAKVAGRKLIMVFLDSAGKLSRIGDAERVRHWVESIPARAAAPVATRVGSPGNLM